MTEQHLLGMAQLRNEGGMYHFPDPSPYDGVLLSDLCNVIAKHKRRKWPRPDDTRDAIAIFKLFERHGWTKK